MIGIDVWNGSATQVQNYAHGAGRNITYPIGMNGASVGNQWGLDRSSFVIVRADGIVDFVTPQTTHYSQRLSQYESEMLARLDALIALTGVGDSDPVPKSFSLRPNVPNPFAVSTEFRFQLGAEAQQQATVLSIYDLLGREVRRLVNQALRPGSHTATWDGRDRSGHLVPAGVYFSVLTSGDQRAVRRVVFLPR